VLARRSPFKFEYEIIAASGQRKWVLEMGQGVFDKGGNVQALEGIIIDITDRKEQEIRLKHISEIDSLTGLHNRRYLESVLANEAADDIKGARAIVLLSLRKINTISLTYGYNLAKRSSRNWRGAFQSSSMKPVICFRFHSSGSPFISEGMKARRN
jgi:predicted signal transduction protein with EAL and GGDEF domain